MAVNPGYTRRQELRCTVADLSTYSSVILYEGENLYVKQNDGKYAVKIGDGTTNIANLPYAINYSDVATQATNASNSATDASDSATTASNKALDAEAYAKGTRNGTAVGSSDPAYHNNSKYYSEQASSIAETKAQEVLNDKADVDGSYEGLHAGSASKSSVSDNLSPYSEDSGTTQENPFISQGTGTDNNSVIVTTGTIARQLEKQGNTPVVNQQFDISKNLNASGNEQSTCVKNQDGSVTLSVSETNTDTYCAVSNTYLRNMIRAKAGHKVLFGLNVVSITSSFDSCEAFFGTNSGTGDTAHGGVGWHYGIRTPIDTSTVQLGFSAGVGNVLTPSDVVVVKGMFIVDLTQMFGGDANIPADLLAHPEHFSWYYNGSMSYDAGSLQNCNGRYLECGQGRNLINQDKLLAITGFSKNGDYIRAIASAWSQTNLKPLLDSYIPTVSYHFKANLKPASGLTNVKVEVLYTDGTISSGTTIQGGSEGVSTVITTANKTIANIYITYGSGGSNNIDVKDLDIELYYTSEQGGEGYSDFHPYIAPIRIDTGNETLKAFDKKLPSGVIERNTKTYTCTGTESWYISGEGTEIRAYIICSEHNITPKFPSAGETHLVCNNFIEGSANHAGECDIGTYLRFGISGIATDSASFNTWLQSHPTTVQYETAEPTTEQGTPFSEYAPINDYSYMAWFDNDGNLVSIPQGCKLFYPVDYKGFTDDLVMYTNGDATALAKNEDITDTALNARGYYKMQDLSSGVTDLVGLTYTVKKLIKQGDVITLHIVARNETESAISANTPLFTMPSGTYASGITSFLLPVCLSSGNTANARLRYTGEVDISAEFPTNTGVYIEVSYTA